MFLRSYFFFNLKSAQSCTFGSTVKVGCLQISTCVNHRNNKVLKTWLKSMNINNKSTSIRHCDNKSNHVMYHHSPTICGYSLLHQRRKTRKSEVSFHNVLFYIN